MTATSLKILPLVFCLLTGAEAEKPRRPLLGVDGKEEGQKLVDGGDGRVEERAMPPGPETGAAIDTLPILGQYMPRAETQAVYGPLAQ